MAAKTNCCTAVLSGAASPLALGGRSSLTVLDVEHWEELVADLGRDGLR